MTRFAHALSLLMVFSLTTVAAAQEPDPPAQRRPAGQQAADDVERTARRFRVGVDGGVGLDPQILDVGVHATLGPVFRPNLHLRPGVEIGGGEVTTIFGINLDVIYTVPGVSREARWLPYVGAGPTFGLSHRGFGTDETDHVDTPGTTTGTMTDDSNRFDFSDTDFNAGMNFIVGLRRRDGMFFEMKATAWGVSNIKLLMGVMF